NGNIDAKDVAGIGLSGQMHGLVMLDADGEVIRRSIIWCDVRTGKECREITNIVGREKLIEITANPALPGFTASKILWVRNNEPKNYQRCRKILLPKDYIRYKLTNVLAAEVSDASGMNLLDVRTREWSSEILCALKIDKAMFCRVYESVDVVGFITQEAAMMTGLALGTPVVAGAGDNAAAAIGTGVVSAGKAFTTLGTSGVVYAHTDEVLIDSRGRVHTFCSAVPGKWCVMSCTQAAGLSLKWFRDNFCEMELKQAKSIGISSYDLMADEASKSPAGANRLIFLPYLMGERSPILDENARGALIGLSAMHTKADLIRAVMEGVAFSQRSCLDILREMGVATDNMMVCGGGARSLLWRQMLADNYDCEINTSKASMEGPALGAAILAGVGVGLYSSVRDACNKIVQIDSCVKPEPTALGQYEPLYSIYKELYSKLASSFAALADI
ncbi:MAG: xylulokinase, partial [Christensenella sp.]